MRRGRDSPRGIPSEEPVLHFWRTHAFQRNSPFHFNEPLLCNSFAERAGFEPAVHFWRTHAFQACSLSHSDTSPLIKKLAKSK